MVIVHRFHESLSSLSLTHPRPPFISVLPVGFCCDYPYFSLEYKPHIVIDNLKYATISQIYIKDLIFYQQDRETELTEFCEVNGITLLPAPDRRSCYKLTNGTFAGLPISSDMVCNPYDRLFDIQTLTKFQKGGHDEVMFVMENDIIRGVVHIVDYNNAMINFEFYKAVYQFEKMLRGLLHHRGETNESLLAWMKEKSVGKDHWYRRYFECCPRDKQRFLLQEEKRRNFGPFQTFYMNDLLHFVADRSYVSAYFRKSLHSIRDLRNWVAHSYDLTTKVDEVNAPLYRIEDLSRFIGNATRFFTCYEELEDMVRDEKIPLDYLRKQVEI